MKTYKAFHGDIPIADIGKKLREIVKTETKAFKIMTGYGSTSGIAGSKVAAIKSLSKMKKEGLIQGFLPGEVKHQVILENNPRYDDVIKFSNRIKQDPDFGNDGIIFVFVS